MLRLNHNLAKFIGLLFLDSVSNKLFNFSKKSFRNTGYACNSLWILGICSTWTMTVEISVKINLSCIRCKNIF